MGGTQEHQHGPGSYWSLLLPTIGHVLTLGHWSIPPGLPAASGRARTGMKCPITEIGGSAEPFVMELLHLVAAGEMRNTASALRCLSVAGHPEEPLIL